MKSIVQIATGVAAGILVAVIAIVVWSRPDKAAQIAAENAALKQQYEVAGAACRDGALSQTGGLMCLRALEAGCELERRGAVGDGHTISPECDDLPKFRQQMHMLPR